MANARFPPWLWAAEPSSKRVTVKFTKCSLFPSHVPSPDSFTWTWYWVRKGASGWAVWRRVNILNLSLSSRDCCTPTTPFGVGRMFHSRLSSLIFLQFVVVWHLSACLRHFMISTSWHTVSIYSIKHHVYHVHLILCGLIHGRFQCLTYIFRKNNCFLPSCLLHFNSINSSWRIPFPRHHASDTLQFLILFLFSARWCDSEYLLNQSD